jgi:acyl carrier protein phosphodiesterase
MNWLAHLLLSEDDPRARLGNLLADLVKRPERRMLAEPYQRGLARHRIIDCFTDAHPRFFASKRRLTFEHDLFHGILVDLFYDHFLARDFAAYAGTPLAEFSREVYCSFETHAGEIPPGALEILRRMAREDWLGCYAHVAGIEYVLRRLSLRIAERTGRVIPLADAVRDLAGSYDDLRADFQAFFPEIQTHMGVGPSGVSGGA